jgi:hypothetical protein
MTHVPVVLEDASGRRARWMRRGGRGVFLLFLAWLVVIVLGGLGLAPVGRVPLSGALRPSHGPPPVARLPAPRPPSPSDLQPALPAAAVAPTRAGGASRATGPTRAVGRGRATVPGQLKKPVADSHGRSATAPGHTKTTRGHSATAPGQVKAKRHGSTTAPGRTTTNPKRR